MSEVASSILRIYDERGEERSDEWKVVSFVSRRYVAFAVAPLHPSVAHRSVSPTPLGSRG